MHSEASGAVDAPVLRSSLQPVTRVWLLSPPGSAFESMGCVDTYLIPIYIFEESAADPSKRRRETQIDSKGTFCLGYLLLSWTKFTGH